MNRRRFLTSSGSVLVSFPTIALLTGCDDDDDDDEDTFLDAGVDAPTTAGGTAGTASTGGAVGSDAAATGGTGGTAPVQGDLTETSTVAQGHTHNVTISLGDLLTPPVGGTIDETTLESGHTHSVLLTQGDLIAIQANQSVTKVTSQVNAHTHSFTFQR